MTKSSRRGRPPVAHPVPQAEADAVYRQQLAKLGKPASTVVQCSVARALNALARKKLITAELAELVIAEATARLTAETKRGAAYDPDLARQTVTDFVTGKARAR